MDYIDTSALDATNRDARIAVIMAAGYSRQDATIAHDAAAEACSAGIDAMQASIRSINNEGIREAAHGVALKMLEANANAVLTRNLAEKLLAAIAAAGQSGH